MEAWSPPACFDEFRLLRPLGRGGMGVVYLAEDTLLLRPVAIKFLHQAPPGAAALERVREEARALARLSHPSVVTVYRVGELSGHPYLVTEYVQGITLDQAPRPLPPARLLAIAETLASALSALHGCGVLHRDIKPQNVILTSGGGIKLIDLGLAQPLAAPSGPAAGTPRYMAPELWRGEEASCATDLYALGVLLREISSGAAPSQESTTPQGQAPPPATAEPAATAVLGPIIERCLCPRPEDRFRSAEELRQALVALLVPLDGAAALPDTPYRGLHPFEAAHSALFFGREVETHEVVERLRGDPLLVVTGPSGVGKSSLCLSGVLPLVRAGGLGDGRPFRTARLRPGVHPARALAAVLRSFSGGEPDSRALRGALSRAGLLLYIDQAEELLTQGAAEAEEFLAMLRALRTTVGCRVLLSLREDFLTRFLLGYREPVGIYALGPLSAEGLRRAIAEPARCCGAPFESEAMVAALAQEARAAEGGLPLLQFALLSLWEARDATRRVIPARALAELGGLEGALARHADQALRALPPEERQAARRLLLRLLTPEGARLRRRAAEMPAGPALEALVRARLVVVSAEEGEPEYELAHEALGRGWPQLRAWREEDAHAALRGRLRRRALLAGGTLAGALLLGGGALLLGLRVRQDLAYRQRLLRLSREEAGLRAQVLAGQAGHEGAALAAALRGIAPDLTSAPPQVRQGLAAAVARGRRSLPLRGHQAEINQVLFAPDGGSLLSMGKDRRVLHFGVDGARRCELLLPRGEAIVGALGTRADRAYIGAEDDTIKVVDLPGCGVAGELRGHHQDIRWLEVVDQDQRLWSGDNGREARLWDLTTERAVAVFPAEGSFGAASPDGLVALGGGDGIVRLREARGGQLLRELRGHTQEVRWLAFAPSGARLVSAGEDRRTRLWDPRSGAAVALIDGDLRWPCFSADGKLLAGASRDGTVRLWDALGGQPLRALESASPQTMARFLSDRRLITVGQDGNATVWDPELGQTLVTLRGHRAALSVLAVSPSGAHVATGGNDAEVRLWSGDNGRVVPVLRGHRDGVWSATFSADGRRLLTTSRDGTARLWDGASGRPLGVLAGHGRSVGSAAFLAGGQVLTRASDGALWRWDERGTRLAVLLPGQPGEKNRTEMALSPDGAVVLTAEPGPGARLRDAATGAVRAELAGHQGAVRALHFSPDGARLVTATEAGQARLWERGGRLIAELPGHHKVINAAWFSPDGATLVTASDDHTARLWDARSGAPRAVLAHADEVWCAAFSPDGTRLATGGLEQEARVWSAADGRLLHLLRRHETKIQAVAWSPDGGRVATASFDRTVRLWDAADGAPRAVLRGHTAWIRALAFSPDGARLASVSLDGTARLWDVRAGRLLEAPDPGSLLAPVPAEDAEVEHGAPLDGAALRALVGWACRLLRPQPEFAQVAGSCG